MKVSGLHSRSRLDYSYSASFSIPQLRFLGTLPYILYKKESGYIPKLMPESWDETAFSQNFELLINKASLMALHFGEESQFM